MAFALGDTKEIEFVRLLQSVFGATAVALVYGNTQLMFARLERKTRTRVALLAATIWAIFPDALFYTQTLYSETLFAFGGLLGVQFVLRAMHARASTALLFAGGIVLGLTALVREIILPFALVGIPPWLILTTRPRTPGWKPALLFFGACSLVIFGWTLRNYSQERGLELISAQGTRDIWIYNPLALHPEMAEGQARKMLRQLAPVVRVGINHLQALWNEIAAKPSPWLRAKLGEVAEIWRDGTSSWAWYGPSLGILSSNACLPLEACLPAAWLVLVICTIIGWIYTPGDSARFLLLLYLLTSAAIFFLTHYMPRFRVGLFPLLLPFTALGLQVIASLIQRQSFHEMTHRLDGRAWLSAAVLCVFAISFWGVMV